MPIKVLDAKVVARIAAGEVVERPASVVKELVENALDASATEISVEIEGNGTGLIRVADNGVGIPAAELSLAFERHATSKIDRFEDLERVSSLGFRGEALPSIASVSEVEVITRGENELAGSYLMLRDGAVVNGGSRARSRGTTVTVKNLFRTVPARLKFLKSPATENSHTVSVITCYALCYPEVRFTLILNGRATLRTPGSGHLLDAVIQVYGQEIARNMIPIGDAPDLSGGGTAAVRIGGLAGNPGLNRSGWDYISFFVNRRWINSRMLAKAVDEAYHGLLMTGKHPVAVINIFLDPAEMDINIHPAKTEVKFRSERDVFAALQKAVRQVLVAQAPVPEIAEVRAQYTADRPFVRPQVRQGQGLWTPPEEGGGLNIPLATRTPAQSLPVLRVLGQVSGSYIVAEGPDGLYLIDQHAAHERILFERISEQGRRREVETQGLLEPLALEVTPAEAIAMKSRMEALGAFGFSVESFGHNTCLVRAVPAVLYREDWEGTLRELLGIVSSGADAGYREKIAITMACHSAVRAGQVLSGKEMEELIRDLERVALPNTCPHGRPTIIHLSQKQLEKEFNRT
ncbi:MAG: DNA mismatch repair endonuclease MutL [Chloroflexota bacterium]